MWQWLKAVLIVGLASAAGPATAVVNVLATTPEWAALTSEIGGDKVNVYVATTALQDVHRVEARPSLMARARNADLLVATGADLEVGWLPVLQRESGNRKIQIGSLGFFEAAQEVRLLDVPASVDRSMGDIHPFGNPHILLDPRNIARVGAALTKRLSGIDSANKEVYEARNKAFQERMSQAIAQWEAKAAPLKGTPVVVYHKDQQYLLNWLGLREVGSLEPKPGVPPSTGHLTDLLQRLQKEPAKVILINAYNDPKPAMWLAERTKIPVATLPYTVGGSKEAKDLFGLFDDTIARLWAGIKQ
jgi:zinc/manganese transport system substrate-binding protein